MSIQQETVSAAVRAAYELLCSPLDTAGLRRTADALLADALNALAADLGERPVHYSPSSIATRRRIGRRLLYIAATANDASEQEIAKTFNIIRTEITLDA